jgi:hypothetical protein
MRYPVICGSYLAAMWIAWARGGLVWLVAVAVLGGVALIAWGCCVCAGRADEAWSRDLRMWGEGRDSLRRALKWEGGGDDNRKR